MLMLVPFLRKFISRIAIALVVTTILSSAGIVMVNDMINGRLANLRRTNVKVADDTSASQPANFLLIGSDSRSFVKSQDDENGFGNADEEAGQRSDTMMIIHVEPKQKKTIVMAIPRDAVVDIPGIGKRKINASFNADLGGGPDKVIETIQSNFDVPIHHYVELDFDTFRDIVSALGSVHVYFPAPARDKKSGLDTHMKSGCIALQGPMALSYVRSRYYEQYIDGRWQSDPTSNYGRIARQQEFMKRVASLAVAKSLTDPLKGRKVVDAVIKKLTVDQNLKKDDIFKLMNAFKGVDPNDTNHVVFETLPVKSVRQNGSWNDIVQTAEAEPMLEQLRIVDNSPEESTTTLPRPSTVKLRVLNASSKKGLAASVMEDMQSIGFNPNGTGNASRRTSTEIHYTASSKSKAQLVAKYISGILIEDSSIADADVVVMLGTSFSSVNSSGGSSTTKATSASSPTTTSAKPSKNGVADSASCPA
jgi:LCP family protein required for cell wall assembly